MGLYDYVSEFSWSLFFYAEAVYGKFVSVHRAHSIMN